MTTCSPFKYFKTSAEIIRLALMYYIRYPLSFRQVEDILHERGVDICHETVRFWVEVLVQNLLRKFERIGRVNTQTGNGTWMKSL
jgi:putative transposase